MVHYLLLAGQFLMYLVSTNRRLILGIGPVSFHIRVVKQLESLVYPQSCLSAHCHKCCTNTNVRVLYCESILEATTVNSSTKTLPAIATNRVKKVAANKF